MFERQKYYSQTEVLQRYKISAKQYQRLLKDKNIPQVNKEISLGEFDVTTRYVLIEDVNKLNLQPRINS